MLSFVPEFFRGAGGLLWCREEAGGGFEGRRSTTLDEATEEEISGRFQRGLWSTIVMTRNQLLSQVSSRKYPRDSNAGGRARRRRLLKALHVGHVKCFLSGAAQAVFVLLM